MANRYETPTRTGEKAPEKNAKKSRHTGLKVLLAMFGCLFMAFVGVYCVYSYYYGLLNYTENPSFGEANSSTVSQQDVASQVASDFSFDGGNDYDLSNLHTDPIYGYDEESQYFEYLRENVEESDVPVSSDKKVLNILLIGYDGFDEANPRSDSMILLSINQKTKKIYMTSIMRDCCVYIPGNGYDRINSAFSWGGPELLMATIEVNFKVKIDRYAAVDFNTFSDIVDILGGITVTVEPDYISWMNDCIYQVNVMNGDDPYANVITQSGSQQLNGIQALAYCRIRKMDSDYGRTERQREVMGLIIQKAKSSSLPQLAALVEAVFPKVTTNISSGEMSSIMLQALSYMSYDVVSSRIPQDGSVSDLWINDNTAQVLKLDMDMNIAYFKDVVYAG